MAWGQCYVIIKDIFIAEFFAIFNRLYSAILEVKALSLKEIVSWLKETQRNNVIIEMDARAIVHRIAGNIADISPLGIILNECKLLLNDCLIF